MKNEETKYEKHFRIKNRIGFIHFTVSLKLSKNDARKSHYFYTISRHINKLGLRGKCQKQIKLKMYLNWRFSKIGRNLGMEAAEQSTHCAN